MFLHEEKKTLFYIRIFNLYSRDILYFRNNLPPDLFFKWKWYFDYRAALFKVKSPKMEVRMECGPYYVGRTKEEMIKVLRDKVSGHKRMVTKIQNQLDDVIKNWNEIFPIEDHPKWRPTMEKVNEYKEKLRIAEEELNKYLQTKINE